MSAERRLAIASLGFRGAVGGGGIVYAGGLDVAVEGELSAAVAGELTVTQAGTIAVPLDLSALTVTVEAQHTVTVDGNIDVRTCE